MPCSHNMTVTKTVPDVASEASPFDYVVVTTKNIPEVAPTVADIIAPAVTPGHTGILLLQNGLNIERPLVERFPTNPILSGISLVGSTEYEKGKIKQDDKDVLKIGPFDSPHVPKDVATTSAKRFVELYSACGKVDCTYDDDVTASRWRKLVYNSTFNSVGAILGMDTSRMRMYEHVIDDLVKPAMIEIKAVASASGVQLPDDIVDSMIKVDPPHAFFKPSMAQDAEKGNFMEIETIVGEPVREASRLGVPVPTLTVIYGILKGLQAKVKEERGLIAPKFADGSRYV
ncbi:hypothetical protein, variant [Verruconis gallopava]|uniref:2-dehydropantoate 2-reductase n=1 Tax=Verruconis gallopava TaxID=253628 RepID=A0A0D2A2G8_9PEZI|nr:hypothetical protein, variant [Verruconis gallopava]KIW00515.1 hypothetical protein, variant [Verruconis gallopava]